MLDKVRALQKRAEIDRDRIENHEIALVHARTVGMATAIIMARKKITDVAACEPLRAAIASQNTKLRRRRARRIDAVD